MKTTSKWNSTSLVRMSEIPIPHFTPESFLIFQIDTTDIADRNFNIFYEKVSKRIAKKFFQLCDKYIKLSNLSDEMEKSPGDKDLVIRFKKLKRSYIDSLEGFQNFLLSTNQMFTVTPKSPILNKSCSTKKACKHNKKQARKNFDKRLTKQRKRERKEKQAEQDFFLNAWTEKNSSIFEESDDEDFNFFFEEYDDENQYSFLEEYEDCDYNFQE